MVRLIMLFVIAFIVFATLRVLLRKQKLTVQQFFVIYFATLVAIALLFAGLTGRLHPLFALAGAALPVIFRILPWISRGMQAASLYKMFKNLGAQTNPAGANAPQTSEINSRFLHMVLFHDTGMMDGTVLEGSFKDAKLSQLELEQLFTLMNECSVDGDSANLLQAYLDREHAGWQDADGGSERSAPPPGDNDMSEAQALDILGLPDDADYDAVIVAHRRMMQKMHPDRGGSTYLAAKINAAKELLVKTRSKGA